jgi:hypothetical protein
MDRARPLTTVRSVKVFIDGSTSHTHAPNRALAAFLWEDAASGSVIGKDQVVKCFYPFGTYTVSLALTDDKFETASTSQTIVVAPESKVPGANPAPQLSVKCIKLAALIIMSLVSAA